jgi:hypothetical protein
MRIAQLAPLAEAVPPKLYGGTERVVSWYFMSRFRMRSVLRCQTLTGPERSITAYPRTL